MTIHQFKDMLIEDLEQMKRKDADKDGKLKILGKDEVKERLGRSPDFGDALMMRMFFELKPAGSGFVPLATTNLVKPFFPQLGVSFFHSSGRSDIVPQMCASPNVHNSVCKPAK
jgi:hypothetical protein